jgi:hypothetical protein
MAGFEIKLDDLPDAFKRLVESQLPFVTSKALNQALSATRVTMHKVMDQGAIKGGPTQFTKRQLQMVFSEKRRLSGMLYFTDKAYYMKELIDGGTRYGRNGRVIPEPDVKNPPGQKILTKKGNFRRNYLQQALRMAGTPANVQWSNLKTKKTMVGSQGFQVAESKNGTFGLWKWTGKGAARRPELLVYLSRKSRTQRATFPNARSIAEEAFTGHFEQNFPKVLGDTIIAELRR